MLKSYKVPIPAPVTEKERKEIKHYKDLQDQIHQGSLYTQPSKRDPNAPAKTYSEDQFNERYGVKSKADVDPFTGVPTYTQKYEQKKRVIPELSGRPFSRYFCSVVSMLTLTLGRQRFVPKGALGHS